VISRARSSIARGRGSNIIRSIGRTASETSLEDGKESLGAELVLLENLGIEINLESLSKTLESNL
jgi:hypothetical protein